MGAAGQNSHRHPTTHLSRAILYLALPLAAGTVIKDDNVDDVTCLLQRLPGLLAATSRVEEMPVSLLQSSKMWSAEQPARAQPLGRPLTASELNLLVSTKKQAVKRVKGTTPYPVPDYTAPPIATQNWPAPPIASQDWTAPAVAGVAYTPPAVATADYTPPPVATADYTPPPVATADYTAPPIATAEYTAPPLANVDYTAPPAAIAQWTAPPPAVQDYTPPPNPAMNDYSVGSWNQYSQKDWNDIPSAYMQPTAASYKPSQETGNYAPNEQSWYAPADPIKNYAQDQDGAKWTQYENRDWRVGDSSASPGNNGDFKKYETFGKWDAPFGQGKVCCSGSTGVSWEMPPGEGAYAGSKPPE